jgi:hypothetical protein
MSDDACGAVQPPCKRARFAEVIADRLGKGGTRGPIPDLEARPPQHQPVLEVEDLSDANQVLPTDTEAALLFLLREFPSLRGVSASPKSPHPTHGFSSFPSSFRALIDRPTPLTGPAVCNAGAAVHCPARPHDSGPRA